MTTVAPRRRRSRPDRRRARPGAARRHRPDRPGAATAGRLRLRRHARADRGRPDHGRARCRRRWPRSVRWPRCRRPRSRSSPGGRCATWPRCPGCPARCTWSAATAPSSTSASSSGCRPSWSRSAPGCTTSCGSIVAGKPGVRLETQAGQRRGARPGAPTPEVADEVDRRACATGPATWPDVTSPTARRSIELSVIADPQGHRARPAAHPAVGAARCCSSATTSPTRTRSPTCTAPTSASRSARARPRPAYRVADPIEAARVLGAAAARPAGNWLFGERAVPIERHSMLANGAHRRAAHPGRQGHLAVPPAAGLRRRSSPTCSAASPAGHFTVAPPSAAACRSGQRYRPGTMTVETRWSGLTVTDWLDDADRELRRRVTGDSTLVRLLTGTGRVRLEFAPRPEFGQVPVRLQPIGDGLLVLGSNEPIALYSPGVEWEIVDDGGHDTARAVVDLAAARRRSAPGAAVRHARAWTRTDRRRRRAAGRRRAAVAGLGRRAASCRPSPASWCCAAR